MKAIISLIFLGITVSVTMQNLEENKISMTDRIAIATSLSPNLPGRNLIQGITPSPDTTATSALSLPDSNSLPATKVTSAPSSIPDTTSTPDTNRADSNSLPDITATSEPSLPSSSLPDTATTSASSLPESSSLPDTTATSAPSLPSNSLPDTTSTPATNLPDSSSSPCSPDSGSAPATITSTGTRNDPGTIRKRSSITLYYLLRSDRQAYPSGTNNLNNNVENESDESLNIGSISSGDNPDEYDLKVSDTLYAWVKEATRIYSPDSWHLLMQYENLPRVSEARHTGNMILSMPKLVGTFEYLEGDNKTGIISSMSTNIHEISHGYYSKNVIRYATENNLLLNSDNVAGFIFLSPNESYYIEFPKQYLFPSKELAASIPRKLRTSRFNTYINGKTLTQSQGVFGLLDELHAFYLGSKFNFEILEGYKIAEGSATEGFYQWISHTRSSMTALFEFDFFILEYLLYMKSQYPQNYASLKSYQPFHDAYAAVRIKYRDLLLSYLDKIQEEIQIHNTTGTIVYVVEGNTLWIKKTGSSRQTGTSIILNDMFTLLPILKSARYNEIEKDFPVVFPERDIYSKILKCGVNGLLF